MDGIDWQVILIGGNTGAGKTYLAQELTRHFRISSLLVDDVRIAIQQVTSPSKQPDLHVFLNYTPEQWKIPKIIVEDWIRVGNAIARPLIAIIEHHLIVSSSGKVIIEGDGILPALASQLVFQKENEQVKIENSSKIHFMFLVEDDEDRILNNLRNRGRGFCKNNQEIQQAFAHASFLYGKWLLEEAKSENLSVVLSYPVETVIRRTLNEIRARI
ncbi:MAG: hypothetical protein ABIG63_13255 [Chloroflexota bacterium]